VGTVFNGQRYESYQVISIPSTGKRAQAMALSRHSELCQNPGGENESPAGGPIL
jgi:hypothetical protein